MPMVRISSGLPSRERTIVHPPGLRHREDDIVTSGMNEGKRSNLLTVGKGEGGHEQDTLYIWCGATGECGIDWHVWLRQEICAVWRRLPVYSGNGQGRSG